MPNHTASDSPGTTAAGHAPPAATAVPVPPAIVALGASAGGLDALTRFVAALPGRTSAAFVVVLHLDPSHASLVPELLARHTVLPVVPAADGLRVEPGHVYVIPPSGELQIAAGTLHLRPSANPQARRAVIDRFFRSLAADQRERATAIVLSGTGTDGTLGLAAVKGEGGVTVAQSPETAAHPDMPANAIASGVVDLVLPPDGMPAALLPHLNHTAAPQPDGGAAASAVPSSDLDAMLALVRSRTTLDFRGYKPGTLQRRTERRMHLLHLDDMGAYVRHLRNHPTEVHQLARDFLIRVTAFFRDPAVFEALAARVMAPLVRTTSELPIRIWVPGCATGEEAYSIAMIAAEQAETAQSPRRVQVFATDVDRRALEIARAGVYPANITLDVSEARLRRFFTRDDGAYRVTPALRQAVVFAAHDLLKDPPFSRLDLVSCRNLLIYLRPAEQRRLMTVFHEALAPGGHLLLGESETIGRAGDLFAAVSADSRLYARLNGVRPRVAPVPRARRGEGRRPSEGLRPARPSVATVATRQLLGRFAPPAIVVDGSGELLHVFGSIGRYFDLPTGAPVLAAAAMIHPALKASFLEAVRRAATDGVEVSVDAPRAAAGAAARVRFTAAPLAGAAGDSARLLVAIEELPAATSQGRAARRRGARIPRAEPAPRRRGQQQLIERLAASHGDLHAAHEDMTAMNQELQSANEELQAAREELQAMNEELTTVNAQLRDRIRELSAAQDDLAGLLGVTDVAAVFLDGALRITRFTPAAADVLHLTAADVGRPLAQIGSRFRGFDAATAAERALVAVTAIDQAVTADDGRRYQVRVQPCRRHAGASEGVVITVRDLPPPGAALAGSATAPADTPQDRGRRRASAASSRAS